MRIFFTTLYRRRAGWTIPLVLAVLCVLFGVGALGYSFGQKSVRSEKNGVVGLINKTSNTTETVDFEAFWKTWNIINDRFVPIATTTSDQQKVYGAIAGLAGSLQDPYTVFFPPAEKKEFEEQVSGQFEGVGMEVGMKDGIVTVVAPLKGNPAERAGMKTGDKILKIDDTVTAGMTVDDAVRRIRGKQGTIVRLTVYREGVKDPFEVSIIRDKISVPTVEGILRDDKVFVIRVHNFSGVVVDQFREALRDFVVSGSTRLVVDLRSNPGGYLEAAVEMASWFLPQGVVVVSEDRGGKGTAETFRSKGYDAFGDSIQIVVLVDGGSASASEIFAGALRDHGRATLIGTKTFGKGSVQELVPITADTALKLTIAHWLTPNGSSISGNGLTPDYEVVLTDEDVDRLFDAQMEAAAAFLVKGIIPKTATTTSQK